MVRTDIPTVHVLLVFTAREGENGLAPGILARLDIPFGITHKISMPGGIKGLIDAFKRLDDIPDPGLAAMASGGRLAGAIKDIVDPGPRRLHAFEHMRGDLVEFVFGKDPFADTRLIRDHKNMIPGVGQQLQSL